MILEMYKFLFLVSMSTVACCHGAKKFDIVELWRDRRNIPEPPPLPGQPEEPPALESYTGNWGDWTEFSRCSATCGQGVESKTRTCRQGVCSGPKEETRPCRAGPCPVWMDWTPWTTCSKTCGKGVTQRSRMCSTYVGCLGDRMERKDCQVTDCAQWLPWGSWGKCDKFCGTGNRIRERQCTVQGACSGETTESQECAKAPCCSKWTSWSACSCTCTSPDKKGAQTRSRRCMVEGPGPMGYASEQQKETRDCTETLSPCAQWNAWEPWGLCTVTCGGGERTRDRDCSIDGQCKGEENEIKRCHPEACPGWNKWGAWTVCSTSCGGGKRVRQRVCDIEGECDDNPKEENTCARFPCPEWSNWASWSYCSESCGGGWQKRVRVCNQYNFCPGDNFEKRICGDHLCPQVGEWEDWAACTKGCGGGTRQRERPCLTDVNYCQIAENADSATCACEGELAMGGACNGHKCAEWNAWGSWGDCDAQCGGGIHTRTRSCNNDPTYCVGDRLNEAACICEGDSESSGDCNKFACPEWAGWGKWGECSASCGGGAKERKRECDVDTSHCTAALMADDPPDVCVCPGLDHSNDLCNAHLCPMWSRWAAWASCAASCGGGKRQRTRTCLSDPDTCTGAADGEASCTCEGEKSDESDCNSHTCAAYEEWGAWGQCSAECAGGVRTRTRSCGRDAAYCFGDRLLTDPSCQCTDGNAEISEPCNTHSCAALDQWSSWESCSMTCGGGMRSRSRQCNADTAHCVGSVATSDSTCQCDGATTDSEACNEFACPVWSDWKAWSKCSVTCSNGLQDRKRTCNRDATHCSIDNLQNLECQCDGTDVDAKQCNAGPCHQWAGWQEWTPCSVVCGGGSWTRARTCPQEGGCPGLNEETAICNQEPCPEWGNWGGWSSCSVSCGGGERVRTRACPLEGGCSPGDDYEVEPCNPQKCAVWAQWGSWGSCSATCGQGSRQRTRTCDRNGECTGRESEDEECVEGACTPSIDWSGWSPCTQTCGGGTRRQSRKKCLAPGCPTESRNEPCSEQTCPTWTEWGPWSQCPVTCGGGSRTHSRQCKDSEGQEWKNGCLGKAKESDPASCNAAGCPVHDPKAGGRMFFFF